jgi:hypothetical protein
MVRAIALILGFVIVSPAFAHTDTKWTKGSQGGHLVDAGKQHWELVAKGNDLVLYILDDKEKALEAQSGGAKARVLIGGNTYNVDFKPAGGNMWKATGDFTAAKGMRVIVTTTNVGGQSFQARLAPLN